MWVGVGAISRFFSCLLQNRTGFQQCQHPSAFDGGGDSGFMVLEKRRPWVSVIVGSRHLIETTVTYFLVSDLR